MEIGKCTQRVLQIIQKLEPENATKIFGYLLLRHNLDELMEYAVGNEVHLHSLIAEAKYYIISTTKLNSLDNLHPYFRRLSFPSSLPLPAPINLSANQHQFFKNMDHISGNNEDWGVKKLLHSPASMGFDLPSNFYLPECGFGSKHLLPLSCHYFNKGFCKHGQSCKFFHGQLDRDCINQMPGIGSNDFTLDDNILFPGLLEKLETEIADLLKERRGLPFSIALLPMLYKEMYGKNLYDEDHLMENHQHGKLPYSLTMLLAQMRSIRLIERPHGQLFVVLVEDAPKFMEFISERTDHSTLSSHQIYLTFPAESTFTDADVQNYFNHFGPVHDVRIPRQEKRMFGFVSFYHPQTVKQILTSGHPHVICGSRVLVKPYKEKSKLVERKYAEKLDAQMYLPSLSFDMDNDLSATMKSSLGPRSIDTFQFHRNQQIEDCKCTFDQDQRELFEQQSRQRLVNAQPFLGYGLEDSKALEGQFSSLIITSHKKEDDVKAGQPGSNCNDFDRLQIQLPDSPFASPRF